MSCADAEAAEAEAAATSALSYAGSTPLRGRRATRETALRPRGTVCVVCAGGAGGRAGAGGAGGT